MQFSESWLRTFVDPQISSEALADLLTMAGLEVEEQLASGPFFDKVVVGEILTVEKHPNADRLNLCTVNVGEELPRQIVCGASNVAVGLKVPCALPGASLPNGLVIREAKVRDVLSSGMLCAASELGLEQSSDGLLILSAKFPVGLSLREALDLDDLLMTLKLTPNRPDCLGLLGLAREVAAFTGAPIHVPEIKPVPPQIEDRWPVLIETGGLCGRYTGRVVRGVNARAETPDYIKKRLERSGLRSISALVDISNYVMLEMNRPNHIFDLDKVKGPLTIRFARKGEKLKLLGGKEVELDERFGVIADTEGLIDLAGIMGGERTACSLDTSNIIIEAAFWLPSAVQGRSRLLGLNTDAGHRFERGVDYADAIAVVERLTALILQICGGEPGLIEDIVRELPSRDPVTVRFERVRRILGTPVSDNQILTIYERLGFSPVNNEDGTVVLCPPSWRYDLKLEIDFVEEIARIIGYNNIPPQSPMSRLELGVNSELLRSSSEIRHMFASRGFQEVITLAFTPHSWEEDFSANESPVLLANPIASHLSVMRSSLLGGLIQVLSYNRRRQQTRLKIFEMARVFSNLPDIKDQSVKGFQQPVHVAGLLWGTALPEQWGETKRQADIFDLKADLEEIVADGSLDFAEKSHPALHPGRSAQVIRFGKPIGWLGELHPEWVVKYDLESAPIVFEVEAEAIRARAIPKYQPPSAYPAVVRDIAVLVAKDISVQLLSDRLTANAPAVLTDVTLFDLYQGKGVPQDMKSLAFRLVFQDNKGTLEDKQVDQFVEAMIVELKKCGAILRA